MHELKQYDSVDQILLAYKNKVEDLLENKNTGNLSENEAILSLCNFVNGILDTLNEELRINALDSIKQYNDVVKAERIRLEQLLLARNNLVRP